MNNKGYVKFTRGVLFHPAFQKKNRELCNLGAFMWLVMEASFVDRKYRINNQEITLKRGQLCCSIRYMAEAWGWDKSKVQRYLDQLKNFSVITSDTPNDTPSDTPNNLTICHYEDYQDTPSDTPSDTKHNKINNKRNNNIKDPAFEEWWKAFNYVGPNKGVKGKAEKFYHKNKKDSDLLVKILTTYNHYSSHQQQNKLGVPMVTTWLNGKNWETYNITPEKDEFQISKPRDYKDYVYAVKKQMRLLSITDDMVVKMRKENLITEEEFKAW